MLVPALWVSAAFGHGKSCAVDASFGARVRSRRHQARMTLEALAARSGVSRAALSKIERGEREPSLTVAVRIADSIGVLLPELLGEQGLPPVQVSPAERPQAAGDRGPREWPDGARPHHSSAWTQRPGSRSRRGCAVGNTPLTVSSARWSLTTGRARGASCAIGCAMN
ncbi:XRE family transcriptional regulator [Saccharopolyspora erythraea D]|nr:XRE family transcriptional regulator [Saccharopolyspora erythraea D]